MDDAPIFQACCRSRIIFEALAEKWPMLILHALSERPKRTGELRRQIEGISEKMLIQSLRKLEHFHLVERRSYAEVPPRVDYRLTEIGIALSDRVRALNEWVEANASALTITGPQGSHKAINRGADLQRQRQPGRGSKQSER